MTGEDEPAEHCEVDVPVDLRAALEAAAIEYLDVDDQRTIAIYQDAILMVTATEGDATAAQAFDVTLWEPPTGGAREPADLLASFIEALLTMTDASRQ